MKLPKDGLLLRIYIQENEKYKSHLLYKAIVLKAHELKLAGATVLRGIMGYGGQNGIHTASILRLSEDMPVVIEIVDTEENINKIMPFLDEVVTVGLITLEKVRVLKYMP